MKDTESFLKLDKTIDVLLGKDGCLWDKKQTHESLKICLINECYEVVDAIDKENTFDLCEELGDVLFQIMFHAKIKELENKFDISDVVNTVNKKMIGRHPHVFGNEKLDTEEELLDSWNKIKQQEKQYKNNKEILKSVPKSLPALIYANNVIKKATNINKELLNIEELLEESKEKIGNISQLTKDKSKVDLDDFGQLIFDLVAISAKFEINLEFALTNATEKFINRFEYIEDISTGKNRLNN